MIRHVLCARDFSAASERAFGYALEVVQRTGATLHLMHVEEVSLGFFQGDPSPAPGARALQSQFEERCRDDLDARNVSILDDRLVLTASRERAAAPGLVQYAETHDVDLLVMGTQGRRGVERAVCGSVAEEVLRTAPCPVLTTRAKQAAAGAAPARPEPIDEVVAPVDFSEPSRGAVRYATRLAAIYDAPLTLVHVVNLPKLPAAYGIDFSDQINLITRSRAELETWEAEMVPESLEARVIVTSGDPVSSILDAASTPGDLIVMATRGLAGVKRIMVGSVAEGVLREAPGPVVSSRSFPVPSEKES
jgi:nucleotide-binding universal stress UspA family protein